LWNGGSGGNDRGELQQLTAEKFHGAAPSWHHS
jgi:hypothetical protein